MKVLNEEEKNAIKKLKNLKTGIEILNNLMEEEYKDKEDIETIDSVLNLIDKMQKIINRKEKLILNVYKQNNALIQENQIISVILDYCNGQLSFRDELMGDKREITSFQNGMFCISQIISDKIEGYKNSGKERN